MSTLVAVAKPTYVNMRRQVVIVERDFTRVGKCFLHHTVVENPNGTAGPYVSTNHPTELDLLSLAVEAFETQDAQAKPYVSTCDTRPITAETLAAALLAAVKKS